MPLSERISSLSLWRFRAVHTLGGKEALRPAYREIISRLPEDVSKVDGHLNYVVTKMLKLVYKPRYFNYNRAVGLLECVKLEFYRVVVSPYEDEKRSETGEV